MILIYTICKNTGEASRIANMLLKLKLIACANWWPIESVSRWKNKIVKTRETAMILKTRKAYYKKIEAVIKKIHSYEVPCIVAFGWAESSKEFSDWVEASD